jgi:hypothetical protein
MRKTQLLVAVVTLAFSGALGCYVSSDPPPPAPPPPSGEVVVESPPEPPPPQAEPPPPAPPAPDQAWVGGYYRWDGHAYGWERGHYERRPHANARWIAPHWEARGRGRVWIEARWE